ncbi:MAG TPA: HAD family hydrolase [Candidatus Eisenbacteria bacterium]|nr:HAD family hydrolase [Candidatus Eisenbacteria bacterium]
MPPRLLAADYDGTLAHEGTVAPGTLAALERLRGRGVRLVLVTGRVLGDLRRVFPQLDRFHAVVAENGAVLHVPQGERLSPLAAPPPGALAERLRERGVRPLSTGEVIVATREPFEDEARAAIAALGLDWHVTLNKGAVMLLPRGVDKASGIAAALAELGVPARDTVGVGDAENDIAFLAACGIGVAVANALPEVRARATYVTRAPNGAGVRELAEALLTDSLDSLRPGV